MAATRTIVVRSRIFVFPWGRINRLESPDLIRWAECPTLPPVRSNVSFGVFARVLGGYGRHQAGSPDRRDTEVAAVARQPATRLEPVPVFATPPRHGPRTSRLSRRQVHAKSSERISPWGGRDRRERRVDDHLVDRVTVSTDDRWRKSGTAREQTQCGALNPSAWD